MNHLNPHFVDHRVDGARNSSGEGQEVRPGGETVGLWKDLLDIEILQRDHEEANHHKNDASDPSLGKYFSDKKDCPDLGEERGRTGDRVDQGKITPPIGCDQTDEIDRLEKTGGKGKPPESGGGLDEKGGKDTERYEKREIKDDAQEKDPEKKLSGPIPFLRKEIP